MGGERDPTRDSRLRCQKGPGNTHRKAAHPPSLSSFKLCFHATLGYSPARSRPKSVGRPSRVNSGLVLSQTPTPEPLLLPHVPLAKATLLTARLGVKLVWAPVGLTLAASTERNSPGDSGCTEYQERSRHDPSHLSLVPSEPSLTWRNACNESFRRTATAAMVTARGPLAAEQGAAEAWRPEGEDERPPRVPRWCSACWGLPRLRPSPNPVRSPCERSERFRITSKNLIRTLLGRQPVRGKIYGFEVCRYPIIKE